MFPNFFLEIGQKCYGRKYAQVFPLGQKHTVRLILRPQNKFKFLENLRCQPVRILCISRKSDNYCKYIFLTENKKIIKEHVTRVVSLKTISLKIDFHASSRGSHGCLGPAYGPQDHLNFRNPGIPSPGGGIKQGLAREFLTHSVHLLK